MHKLGRYPASSAEETVIVFAYKKRRIMASHSPLSNPTLLEPEDLKLPLGNDDLLIQVTSQAVFAQAHIEGAVLIEPAQLCCGVAPAVGKLPDLSALQQTLSNIGYHPERRVIAYDDEGGGWAGKLLWIMDVIGHADWAYLNGGLHAWAAARGALSSGAFAAATNQPPIQLGMNTQPIAEVADVLAAINEPTQVILDVRSRDEYVGLRSGSARAGHIPGAVNLDWELLKDPSRHWRLRENLHEDFAQLGIDQSTQVITHCQTHHRSGLSYLVGRLLGIDIRAYHGSWAEWGNDPDLPIE